MSNFDQYEKDLLELIKSAKTSLADKIPIADANERKALIRKTTKEVDDMSAIISDMDYEISKFGPNSKTSYLNKLKKYKLDIDLIQRDLKKANASTFNSLSSSSSNPNYQSDDVIDPERKIVLQMHKSLMNADESLARTTRVAIESEQIGHEVLSELNEQGDRLRQSHSRLEDTRMALSKSQRIINAISRGVLCNKALLIVIIVLEFIAIGGVIYWKFFT